MTRISKVDKLITLIDLSFMVMMLLLIMLTVGLPTGALISVASSQDLGVQQPSSPLLAQDTTFTPEFQLPAQIIPLIAEEVASRQADPIIREIILAIASILTAVVYTLGRRRRR